MGLFAYKRNEMEMGENTERIKQLKQSVKAMDSELEYDYGRRVNGDNTYVGYQTLRDFYKGRQWQYEKVEGVRRTYNYVFTIVENMTAFLTNEPPQMSVPPIDPSDPIQRSIAEGATKLLESIHEANEMPLQFQKGVRIGSMLGDSFIFGPIPTFTTDEKGVKTFDMIRYWIIEKPENIRVIWKDDNHSEIHGFIKRYRISVEQAKRLFKKELDDNLIEEIVPDETVTMDSSGKTTNVPMVTVQEYWDDTEYLLMFHADCHVIHYIKHDWGFVPLQYIPNIHLPGEAKGTSDIENELDAQVEYNETASALADIVQEISSPTYWGKNIDNLTEIRSGRKVIYNLPDDGDLQAMPKSGQTFPMESYLNDRKNDMIALSGLNQVLYPGSQTMQATGRALSVIMQGVNNKISLRKEWWARAFKSLNSNILYLAERYLPEAKFLINGNYRTDVFIASVLLRSISEEINKFNSKLQSLTTTQKNIGIMNPSEEQKLQKEELQDDVLATEIAKQPALLQQIMQNRMAAQSGGVNGAAPGIAEESENEEGENPQSSAGVASPLSPEGAVRQAAARAGAPTQLRK